MGTMTMKRRRVLDPAEARRVYGPPDCYGPGGERDAHDDRIITPEHADRAVEHMRQHGVDWPTAIRATRNRLERYAAVEPGYGEPSRQTASWGEAGVNTPTPIVAADACAVSEYVRRHGCSWREGVEAIAGASIMEADDEPPVKCGMPAAMKYIRTHPGLSPEQCADILASA